MPRARMLVPTAAAHEPRRAALLSQAEQVEGMEQHKHEHDTERLARYEHALQRLALGALAPTLTAHPFTAICRVATRLLEGAELDQVLRELDREGRVGT
jgi:hypothetical protein